MLKEQLAEYAREQEAPDFWDNLERAQHVSQQIKNVEARIARYEKLVMRIDDALMMVELVKEEEDQAEFAALGEEVASLAHEAEQMRLTALLRGEYDHSDAILSLHAGAGGTEAQDWTEMLYRMYTRYCERQGFSVKLLDILDGDEAGIKSVSFEVSGDCAYGYLKAERGVHRLVRISPFDSSARRHTSFASLDVMPVIEDESEIVINPDELRVDTYRSSGAGGQHVNKTESAIRLTHIPTGLVAACQTERSQMQNRETAMRMLRSKLMEMREREAQEKAAEIKGELKRIEWGSQIRSYVFHPYKMVKDHRTDEETGNVDAVMDGGLDAFITAYLQKM